MTGFRLALGGAQELYGITPDLTTLGKIIGGGLPVGAYGGPPEIMDLVAPLGPMYQAGTLSGNPLAMAAGIATLGYLMANRGEIYPRLESLSADLVKGVSEAAREAGVGLTANRVGSMFTWFFTHRTVTDWESAATSDTDAFGKFFRSMLDSGIYLPPSQFEAAFLSAVHTEEDVQETVAAAREAFALPKLAPQVIPVNYLRWDVINRGAADDWGVQNVDSPRVRIVSMNAVQRPDRIVIVGEIVNEDTVPAYVDVNATLLHADGSPITQENSFDKISHILLPKQVSPYRVDFPGYRLTQIKSVRMDAKSMLVPASADPVIEVTQQKLQKDALGKMV